MRSPPSLSRLAAGLGSILTVHVATAATHIVTVNADGTFTPARVEIVSGDTVEWQFSSRADTIVPVNLDASGQPDCTNYKPYVATDTNDFTGPAVRAASGIYALSPEELPYTTQPATWESTQLAGVFIRPRWDDVHPDPGQFDWSKIDLEIDQAVRNGKVYSIGFKAGVRGTPQWIFDPAETSDPVPALDFGYTQGGKPAYFGSPAEANYRKHYFDLLRAFAAHLRENNARYRALAYIKISGANLISHENRLPKDTTADLALWAGAGKYTPTALLSFYQEQTALLAAEFPGKDMAYALIQDGFPEINDQGEYLGQPTPPVNPLPTGARQTELVMAQGRTEHGLRFVVQHNGLQEKPAFCPNSGVHPIVLDDNFHYVGSGCPNRWVLAEASAGQVTGYQDVAGLPSLTALESSFQNQWDNSDGVFLEIYESLALMADGVASLPSGLTLGHWNERFHQRRRDFWPGIADPFPLVHRHTFTRTAAASTGPQLFHYVNARKCTPGAANASGTVSILPGTTGPVPEAPLALAGSVAAFNVFNASWQPSAGATGYRIDVATDAAFTGFVAGQQDRDLGNVLSAAISGLGVGTYYFRVRGYNANGVGYTSAAGTIEVGGRAVNLSTRGPTASGDNVMIAGFVVGGAVQKQVLIRAVGPTLATDPFNIGDTVPNPRLRLQKLVGGAVVSETIHDDWSAADSALVAATDAVGAFALNSGSLDAAALVTLDPGSYTAQVESVTGVAGIAIVEVYETGTEGRLINISTRGFVGTGNAISIPGTVVTGGPKRLLVRAVGETIGAPPFGVPGVLADPQLDVFAAASAPGSPPIFSNDDWGANANAAEIATVSTTVGAFDLPANSKDAALLLVLDSGAYTFQVRGKNGATGIVIVEIYEVP